MILTWIFIIAATIAWSYFCWAFGFRMAMFSMKKFWIFYPFNKRFPTAYVEGRRDSRIIKQ